MMRETTKLENVDEWFHMNKYLIKDIYKDENISREEMIQNLIYDLIICIGENPLSKGLEDTPQRVQRMFNEIYEGMNYSNEEIAKMYNRCFEVGVEEDLVTVTNIPIFSTCEHHLATIYNMKCHVGYLPNGRVIGLSKIARIADMVARRIQLQERIGKDIADILEMILDTSDIIVVIEGEHSCMTMRGIQKPGTITKTATLRGRFHSDSDLRKEFYNLLK